jgi:hypothetical protein
MGRPKRLSDDAEPVRFYLTPEEQLILQIIRVRRKKRNDPRIGPSEIAADGLMLLLEKIEGLSREQIDDLLEVSANKDGPKLKRFPKRENH